MSDSIARLSVLITGDASPLGRATQQGAQFVKQFEAQTGNSMTAAGNSAKAMSAAFAVASGNLSKLTSLASLGWIGAIAIAAAAAGKLAFNLAAASDALEVAAGGDAAETWAGQWDRVQAAALSIAQTLGRPLSEALTRETATWARILENVATSIMPEQIRRERELAASMEQRKKLAEEIAKKEREAAEAASKAFQAAQDRARTAAARITESLRTPAEVYADTVGELARLFGLGLVNVETFTRGMAKARADAVSASKTISEAKAPPQAVNAVERFTSSGQSAFLAAQRAQQQLDVSRSALAQSKSQTKLQEEIVRELRKRKEGVTLGPANL